MILEDYIGQEFQLTEDIGDMEEGLIVRGVGIRVGDNHKLDVVSEDGTIRDYLHINEIREKKAIPFYRNIPFKSDLLETLL